MSFVKKLWGKVRLPKLNLRGWAADHREGLKRAAGELFFWGSFAFVVLLIHREVYSFIMKRRQYTIESSDLRVSVAPRWARELGQDSFVELPDAKYSLFDDSAVARVGRAIEASPWVRKVTAVDRVFPNEVRVKFEYRKPHVVVRRGEGYVVVDRDSVRLPGIYAERPPSELALEIVGLEGAPPAPGTRWEDPGLAVGMEMARVAESDPLFVRAGVVAVDVSNAGGRMDPKKSEIVLQTSSGAVILWGRPPSTPRHGEITIGDKLANLAMVLDAYPYLEGLKSARVNVKGKPFVVESDPRMGQRRR